MNTLKVTKWLGFTLLCLGVLSITLALAGLSAARDFQDRFSQVNPDREAAQTALTTGQDADENYLAGVGKMDHKKRRPRLGEHSLAGWAKTLDNTGRLLISLESPAVDPANGGHYYLAGWAKMVDNTGRIQG